MRKFDFSMIDNALTKLGSRNVRMTLRVVAYSSCCDTVFPNNTNIGIPDWVRAISGTSASYVAPPSDPSPGVMQVVPNWNNPNYLNAFGQLLAALGHRYDRDERLSAFEFSGYGDFSENHIAYLRDVLGAPGPAPDDSVATLGYYSQFRDQSITIESIRQLVAANVNAFPRHTIGDDDAEPGNRSRTARRRSHEKTVRAGRHPLRLPRRVLHRCPVGPCRKVHVTCSRRIRWSTN